MFAPPAPILSLGKGGAHEVLVFPGRAIGDFRHVFKLMDISSA